LLGLLLAAAAVKLLAAQGPASVPRLAQSAIDPRLFAFVLGASVITGILFGIAPALRDSEAGLSATLNEGGRGGTTGRSGRAMRNALVVAELALAVIVLIGSGLLIRSFVRLRSVNPSGRGPDGAGAALRGRTAPLAALCSQELSAARRFAHARSAGAINGAFRCGGIALCGGRAPCSEP
jgi:hypothetical protein